jgi:hypothetical protein
MSKIGTHWVGCWRDHPECAKARIEAMASALAIIQTWATFAYGDMLAGHALVPDHVADLCRETLAMVRE